MSRPPIWLTAAGALAAGFALSLAACSRDRAIETTVAVLPFRDETGSPDSQQYLSDGVAEDLTDLLARCRGLRVTGRASAFLLRGHLDAREIRRELKAGKVVQGSVRRSGALTRVAARLIDTGDGRTLWSGDREGQLLAVEAEIAAAVAAAMNIPPPPPPNPPPDPSAYDQCLRARYELGLRSPDALERARPYVDAALRAAPLFAPAHAGLGELEYAAAQTGAREYRAAMGASRIALRRAVELDGSLASARVRLGTLELTFGWDWARAGREFDRALEAAPGWPPALARRGLMDCLLGRERECVERASAAAALDPLSPSAQLDLALALYLARRWPEAVRVCDAVLNRNPAAQTAYYRRGWAHAASGDFGKALEDASALERLRASPLLYRPIRGFALARQGRAEEAKAEIGALRSSGSLSPFFALALVYLGLADREGVFDSLGRAAELPDPYLPYLAADPLFTGLQSDPRFRTLLVQVGAPAP